MITYYMKRKSDNVNARKLRGEQIAKTVQIQKKGLDKWIVPSQTGSGAYTVNRFGENFKSSCLQACHGAL